MAGLCERCVKIPRPIYFQRSSHFPARSIGTKYQIKARKDRCPFCRLIYNAVFDNSISYRVDDKSRLGVIWNGEYYYFSTGYGEELGIKIAVIQALEEHAILSPTSYSYARPVTGLRVDLKRVQSWLDLCQKHHQQGSALQQMSVSAEPGLMALPARVIDVQEGCVVSLTPTTGPDTRYVTLSYVWGEAVQYKLLTTNKDKLMTHGSLSSESIRNQLPRTIRDAITVVSDLGLRYLWVDALCIVQDDADDKSKEIYRMDAIYESSVFTLIAGSGTHADAGLAVLHARQGSQECETIWPGIRMTAIHDVQDVLDSVKYGTRGWTFQEQVLSSRILVFTDHMVYFHCHECTWSEDSRADETPRQRTKIGGPHTSRRVELFEDPWMLYCTYLEQYSQRELTNDEDRVKAMMGMLQRIRRKLQCRLVEGLLSDAFEWGLNFDVNGSQRCLLFPSYSWAGWKGRATMEWPNGLDFEESINGSASDSAEDSDSDYSHMYGRSYSSGGPDGDDSNSYDGDSTGVDEGEWEDVNSDDEAASDNFDSSSDSTSQSEYDYHTSDVGSAAAVEGDPDSEAVRNSLTDFTDKAAQHVAKSTWIVWYERPPRQGPQLITEQNGMAERQGNILELKSELFNTRARLTDDILPTEPTHHLGSNLESQLPRHYPVLQFWTVSFKLRFGKFGVASAHRANLLDRDDEWCGQLRLPEDLDPPQSGSTAELILLSVTRDHHILMENPQMYNGIEHFECGQRDSKLPQFYRVMWIQRRGKLAERVAVGEIHHSALRRPAKGRASWKEIILS